ncbi:GntR family transcriptional regulator [Streptomyces albidus (ex Kaewkla and Franco 2022)]|uniref:GntR family transcriptional regulator n=1 Tax=Streptomyces albidus (ex Kaewkla and Franco 2022) TaxID=722709 RepID=UPI0015EF6120|nr:GntR family transcriptional regulator [Streptomyces albidus (ex Kaewkla and Franco 2022)]
MEQTGADAPEQSGRTALHPHLPPQSPSAGQQHPAQVDDDRGARGEHVHSEPPPPVTAAMPGVPPPGRPALSGQLGPPGQTAPPPGRRKQLPQRYSVRAQILNALREALLSGELVPGEVYSAPALAERFGVSATPVREAMQRLVCEGAVETVPNRGFRVAVCSARDLAELAEIRALLEIPSVLEAARSMPPECWESLRPLADEALAAAALADRATYASADGAFHGALLELTGNRQLVAVATDIHRRVQRRPAPLAPSTGAAELMQDASDHVVLLDALRARDLATVERLMREHVAL